MKREKGKPDSASQLFTTFPISHICGMWKSVCGSPGLNIYHDGSRFRLQFSYKQDTAFTVLLHQFRGVTFFYFYGMIRIAYDDERDMLFLSTEGKYIRVYDEYHPENQ